MGTYSKLLHDQATDKKANKEANLPADNKVNKLEHLPGDKPVSNLKSKHTDKLATKQANKDPGKVANQIYDQQPTLSATLAGWLQEKPTLACTFRYPPDLVEAIEDMLHEVKKKYRVKLTKNTIGVTAIVCLLADYENAGDDSMLHRLLIEPDK